MLYTNNIIAYQGITSFNLTLSTGKNEKEYSWHVPAIKFIGMKQLV